MVCDCDISYKYRSKNIYNIKLKEDQILSLMAMGMSEEMIYKFISECIDISYKSCLTYFEVCDRKYYQKYYELAMGNHNN